MIHPIYRITGLCLLLVYPPTALNLLKRLTEASHWQAETAATCCCGDNCSCAPGSCCPADEAVITGPVFGDCSDTDSYTAPNGTWLQLRPALIAIASKWQLFERTWHDGYRLLPDQCLVELPEKVPIHRQNSH